MLRVIAGKYKSLKFNQPPLEITRPTTDRIRESIFNIIQSDIKNSIVLDCFGGSGAMSIESSSRCATKIICVEKNKIAFNIILENIEKLKINNIDVFQSDIFNYLKNKENIEFDLIFLDPPYKMNQDDIFNLLDLIINKKMLKKYGKIIYETSIETTKIKLPKKLMISNERIYGGTKIYVLNQII